MLIDYNMEKVKESRVEKTSYTKSKLNVKMDGFQDFWLYLILEICLDMLRCPRKLYLTIIAKQRLNERFMKYLHALPNFMFVFLFIYLFAQP